MFTLKDWKNANKAKQYLQSEDEGDSVPCI
uniref:Uncharacterized protein n=1 Tax=Anguilla anguilla TaxID=7936 RepID=A0A0E9PXQ3_ANGAN